MVEVVGTPSPRQEVPQVPSSVMSQRNQGVLPSRQTETSFIFSSELERDVIMSGFAKLRQCDFDTCPGCFPGLNENKLIMMGDYQFIPSTIVFS